jgi:hypothetical protein
MRNAVRLLAALAVLVTACSDQTSDPDAILGPGPEPTANDRGRSEVVALTRNLYVGTDVDAVIGALQTPDPADDFPALVTAIETLGRTDFPSRAAAIAGEIARARPHVVGLQEVSQVDVVLPPLGVAIHLDFLPTLLSELAERGLHYVVASRVKNIEAQPLPGVSLVDFDVMLVDRRRVRVLETGSGTFATNLGAVAPGVVLRRGWVAAKATVDGETYTFASTHLESGQLAGLDQIRAAQAGELIQLLSGARRVVLMGDLNDVPGSPMYQALLAGGYLDAWTGFRPRAAGLTCCHAPDLSNSVQQFDERIDYVFLRLPRRHRDLSWRIRLIGDDLSDRISGPAGLIWPSDHAGLLLRLDAR